LMPIKTQNLEEALDRIGFSRGSIVESVLTTLNPDGSVNAAPMGVARKGPVQLEIRPYRSSKTHSNLNRNPEACVNVINDPAIFLVTAFKEEKFDFSTPRFSHDNSIEQADAVIFLTNLEKEEFDEDRSYFVGEASSIKLIKKSPTVFSRGKAQTIEAIIRATRIEYYLKNRKSVEAEYHIDRFNKCKQVILKVSPQGSPETRIVEALEKLIDRWRAQA
jgi:hypothetical protein